MQYGVNDIPPIFKTVVLGLQQIFVLAIYRVLVSFIANTAKLSAEAGQSLMSMSLIMMGIGAMLQAFHSKLIGSGFFLLANCPAVNYFVPSLLAAEQGGIALV